ncbi:hypothetical protein GF312_10415, partial [Candidatus Poribacteria bacterium]|nr:hypothetical protein [Candidatus Poribacteria bacterium]
MSDKEIFIIHTARSLARRMNLCGLIRFTSVTMLWGIGLIAMIIIISKFWILPVPVLIISILILVISIVSGLIRAFTSRVSPVQALIKAESTLNLKERLSSALEISLQDKKSYLEELQLNDAYQHCLSIKPEVVCPRMFTTSSKLLPLFVVLLFSFNFIPAQYADPYYIPLEIQKDIKDIATELDKKMDELNNEKLSKQEKKLISDIKDKTRNIQNETTSKKDALLVL